MAASKARITKYQKALVEVLDAQIFAEQCRAAIVKAGCPHPIAFLEPWATVISERAQVIKRGDHCTICRLYLCEFSSAGWVPLHTAEYENVNCCPHREEWHTTYQWHHGYGKYITGVECGNCRARKSFQTQGYWNSYSEWSQWRRDRDDD